MELLLTSGRIREASEWFTVDFLREFGPADYHWLKAQMTAARGDYEAADEHLQQINGLPEMDRGPWHLVSALLRAQTPMSGGPMAGAAQIALAARLEKARLEHPSLDTLVDQRRQRVRLSAIWATDQAFWSPIQPHAVYPSQIMFLPWFLHTWNDDPFLRGPIGQRTERLLAQQLNLLRGEADLAVLRGSLALEAGQPRQAKQLFRDALTLWRPESGTRATAPLDFAMRPAAEAYLEWFDVRAGKPR
jgi:hypothetical protein